ncbi:phage head-tail connector protein [Tepidimicrobium xylanilyticum]|uniref:Phage gp6-like head-tail connector protein n=1 Tax=Tepidimicrobium xylanilyticum TaxID=1123352 RepID=A0A1H3FH08_9FIRM|nr:phage head-tail connector protein [Tepidimicrobium xylanilyticum]SDX89668.1 Phage gp6-like head-tail connector protein [Tepidimicrobium xylanilyticum]
MLEKLKLLLGIKDDSKDAILEFTIERVEDTIKNYCNIEEIPEELNTTVLSMAMELCRLENFGNVEGKKDIKSIQVGDTTTTFETNKSIDISNELLKDYKAQLAPYRKIRW